MTQVVPGKIDLVAGASDIERGVWERLARLYAELEKREWEGWKWDHFHGNRFRGLVNTELRKKGLDPINFYVVVTPERPPQGPLPEGWSPAIWYVDVRLREGHTLSTVTHTPTISEKATN